MKTYKWAVMEANLNPVKGAEQRRSRPVLIISNEEFNQAMPNVTVLPITSTKRGLYPSEVFLPQGMAGNHWIQSSGSSSAYNLQNAAGKSDWLSRRRGH
jgi:mRNA interferase MazF